MNIKTKKIIFMASKYKTHPSSRTLLNSLLNLYSPVSGLSTSRFISIHRRPGAWDPILYVCKCRFFTRPLRASGRARRSKRAMMRLLRLVHDEGRHLHLLLGVEADHPDVVVRILLLAVGHLRENLVTVGAAEHRELPHHPVAVVVEARSVCGLLLCERALGAVELEAGRKSLAEHVRNLLLDVIVRQRREVREGLELNSRLPHQHARVRRHGSRGASARRDLLCGPGRSRGPHLHGCRHFLSCVLLLCSCVSSRFSSGYAAAAASRSLSPH